MGRVLRGVDEAEPCAFGEFELKRLGPGVHGDIEARFVRSVGEFDGERVGIGGPVGSFQRDAMETDVIGFEGAFEGVGEGRLMEGFEALSQSDHSFGKTHDFVG